MDKVEEAYCRQVILAVSVSLQEQVTLLEFLL